jgi:hypothetical protein
MLLKKAVLIFLAVFVLAACNGGGTQTGTDTGGTDGGTTNGGTDGNGETGGTTASAVIADHLASAAFNDIPQSFVDLAKTSFKIYYGHTSHGSQILTGMEMLQSAVYDYAGMSIEEENSDLGHNGDTGWADTTRSRLNQPGSTINVVMWSWCGGVQDNTESGINTYLATMNQLEQDYPAVKFIYMTGHLSDDPSYHDNLLARNQQIRDYCRANNKILFDFADIESYDPDGVLHNDVSDTDACQWCTTWCASHACPACGGCAHSHCFNCYLKGKAFWWLLARMAGWSGS